MNKIEHTLKEKLKGALEDALSSISLEKFKRKINDAYADIEYDIDYELKERMQYNLSYYVVDMTEKAINSILDGNEEALRRYLSCALTSYSGRDNTKIINGSLFEHGGMALRKKIVDAYPDLLKNERILDLESQVSHLVSTINIERERFEKWKMEN